jgi:uncharacterized protein (TIGR03083 family)
MATTTDPAPTRAETLAGVRAEYLAFADLVAGLSDAEWATPSRCAGFDVRDVAGHVIGLAEDLVLGKPGSRTPAEEAASVRDDPPATAGARLTTAVAAIEPLLAALDDDALWNGPSPVPDLTMAQGVLTLWYDTFVHADDIHAAIGRGWEGGPGEIGALTYLAGQLTARSYGPVRVAITDHDDTVLTIGPVDAAMPTVRTDARSFILAATGRLDAAAIGLDAAVNIYAE